MSGISFQTLCRVSGLPEPVAEYRFAPPRRWRFDWAFIEQRIAVEVEGGVFLKGGGRHTRGAGFRNDVEKYGEAAAMGWRVFRVLPEQLVTPMVVDWLTRAMPARTVIREGT